MTNFVDVVEVNPIMFVKQIVEQIGKGFYVQNTIPGYPLMGLPYQIRMFDTKPTIKNALHADVHTAVVEGYDVMLWLLDVQDIALQGFTMDLTGAVVDAFKSVTLKKAVPVKFDLGVAPEATVEAPAKAKRAKSKPTVEGE